MSVRDESFRSGNADGFLLLRGVEITFPKGCEVHLEGVFREGSELSDCVLRWEEGNRIRVRPLLPGGRYARKDLPAGEWDAISSGDDAA